MKDPLPIEAWRGAGEHEITPPGSKSVTCRAYMLAALATGRSRLVRPLRSDDTDKLLAALATLGAEHVWQGDDVVISGVGGRFPRGGEVNLGHGGAPSRFMTAAACLADETVIVDGSTRMRERPVGELIELMRSLGSEVEYLDSPGCLPVRVHPGPPTLGGILRIPTTASSQFITALLLIAPHLRTGLTILFDGPVTSRSYVDLTIDIMRGFGIEVNDDVNGLTVPHQPVAGGTCTIPPDASSAVYWWTAAALQPGRTVRTPGIAAGPRQPDGAYLQCLRRLGAAIVDDETVRGAKLNGSSEPIDMTLLPDAALSLATLAATVDGPTHITGLRTLRVKETDRIAALATELTRIGCTVRAGDDDLYIDPSNAHEEPAIIETYDDHRMAMAFAILGLHRGGIAVRDPGCVGKSYPRFWHDLARLAGA